MLLKILVLSISLFTLVFVTALSSIEYLDFELSNFPSVSILLSMEGYYYPANTFNFLENGNSLPYEISLLKETKTETLDVHFFVDTSLSMNNKVKSVQNSLKKISDFLESTESDNTFYFYTLDNYINSIKLASSLEIDPVISSLFSIIDSPDEKPLKYLNKIADKTTSPSIFILFTDDDGFKNIDTDTIEETSRKLYSSGCYLFVVNDTEKRSEIKNIDFIDYFQINKISFILDEIKNRLLMVSFTSPDDTAPLRNVAIYDNDGTYIIPMKEEPVITLAENYEKHDYVPGDTLLINGSIQGDFQSFSVTHNNSPVTFSLEGKNFSSKINLVEGLNLINITASGNKGKDVLRKEFFTTREKTSNLEIILEWEAEDSDIDLYVKEPAGWVYFLDKDRTGFLKDDIQTGGNGKEHYILSEIIPGSYEIYAHAYKIKHPTICNLTVLVDGDEITNKSFRLNESNIENCFPGNNGEDWHFIAKLDF
ncbi:MAG: hypothetical protein ACOC80_04205 [Petrotogales bacterium]